MAIFEVVTRALFAEATAGVFEVALFEEATVGMFVDAEGDALAEDKDAAYIARGTVEGTPIGTMDGS